MCDHPKVHALLPLPEEQPTMTVPDAGKFLGLSRSSSYEAAGRGEIPVLEFGRRLLVPTAALRRLLGLDPPIHQSDTGSIQDRP